MKFTYVPIYISIQLLYTAKNAVPLLQLKWHAAHDIIVLLVEIL